MIFIEGQYTPLQKGMPANAGNTPVEVILVELKK